MKPFIGAIPVRETIWGRLYRCEPEDADTLVKSIAKLAADKILAEKLGYNATAYANTHIAMDQVLGQFEAGLGEICDHGTD